MIEFDRVSKSFWTGKTRKVILDQASFRVEPGNSIGILAENGAGKTTIINMMAGLEQPDEGLIRRNCRVSFPLGFMGGVVGNHTAKENCRYIARLYGLDPDYVEAFCRWVCGLEEYFDMPIKTYSAGMRARFTFALLLSLEFDIYLIDEGMPGTTDVRCIYEHSDNSIWMGSNGGGLLILRDGKFTQLKEKDGLSGNEVFAITPELDGNTIWLATDNGITRIHVR